MTATTQPIRGRVLIVDRDPGFSESCITQLGNAGFHPLTAPGGSDACQLLATGQIDVVIIAVDACLSDGTSALPHILSAWPDIPVVLSGTTDQASEITRASRQGTTGMIFKPLSKPAMLTHVVNCAMGDPNAEAQPPSMVSHLKEKNRQLMDFTTRLKGVMNSSSRLSSCNTLESFGSRLLEEFGTHLKATGGSLYLAGRDGLRLIHCLDGNHAPPLISYPLEKSSPFGSVLRHKSPLLINNIDDEAELRPSGYGGYRNGSFVIFPLQNQQGKPFGLVSLHGKSIPPFIHQDREVGALLAAWSAETLRAVRATEALGRSQEKYRLAALTASDILCEWNPKDDRLTWYGEIDTVIGSDPESRPATMEAWLNMIHPDDRQRMMHLYHNTPTEKAETPANYRVKHPARGWLHFRERMAALEADASGTTRVIRACNDITEEIASQGDQEQNERKMQHAQRLESLGVIAGGIAHDFNNILMAVLGHADIALEEVHGIPVAVSSLNHIVSAGKRATELARQLLAYSGKGEMENETVSLSELVQEMTDLISVNISKKATIDFSPSPHTPPVEGNKSQLRQVILNLITNASQALGNDPGTITITTGKSFCTREDLDHVSVPFRKEMDAPLAEGTYAFIDIKDTGCGIQPEAIEKLFDPFYTTKSTGTGLGMAAVLGITRRHRGTMQIQSTPGMGTTIRVLLPASLRPQLKSELTGETPVQENLTCGEGLILLADDEEPVRNISRRMLEKLGFKVLLACDGEEAVSLFEANHEEIRCVILDRSMPGLDGLEALAQIRKRAPEARAIIASGYGAETQNGEAMPDTCTYLQKPYQSSELRQALKSALAPSP